MDRPAQPHPAQRASTPARTQQPTARSASDPAPAPQPAQRQPRRVRRAPLVRLPPRRVVVDLDPHWRPPPNELYVLIELRGPEHLLIPGVQRMLRAMPLALRVEATTLLPPDAWEQLPLGLFSPLEKGIIQEDLRMTSRAGIAHKLSISVHTVTTYRTRIRQKLKTLPVDQRPVWIEIWLRRFPGYPRPGRSMPKRKR
ncbi:MAG: hypothetical protein OHK0022_23600 [Roseiflexaceae bacterium]